VLDVALALVAGVLDIALAIVAGVLDIALALVAGVLLDIALQECDHSAALAVVASGFFGDRLLLLAGAVLGGHLVAFPRVPVPGRDSGGGHGGNQGAPCEKKAAATMTGALEKKWLRKQKG
jgi:hypothetical protein